MSKRIDDIISDIKEIKKEQSETNVKLARYNELLDIHIMATNDLRARVKPIEDHVAFIRSVTKFLLAILALPASVYYLLKLFG